MLKTIKMKKIINYYFCDSDKQYEIRYEEGEDVMKISFHLQYCVFKIKHWVMIKLEISVGIRFHWAIL